MAMSKMRRKFGTVWSCGSRDTLMGGQKQTQTDTLITILHPPYNRQSQQTLKTKPRFWCLVRLLCYLAYIWPILGIVELCAKILQIMRNAFADDAPSFCQLCTPFPWLWFVYFCYLKTKILLN